MPKTKQDGQSKHEAVRLDAAMRARVDAEEARLRAANPTLTITRSDTLRSLLLRGLDASAPGPAKRRTVVPLAEPVTVEALGAGGPVAVKGEC